LVSDCATVVLDEPAAALDLRNQAQVLTVLRALADEGMAVVMTTHHPDHALHVAEQSMLMVSADDQRIGPTRELLTGALLSEMYGVPIVTADIETPSATRRLTVPDFGRGIS
jgi:iron complex transport system ATP-binding protein